MELPVYNLRHVQHHARQLNLILRQGLDSAPAWVARAEPLQGEAAAGQVDEGRSRAVSVAGPAPSGEPA